MNKRSFCKKLLSFILSLCLLMGGLGLQPVEVHAEGESQAGTVIYVGGENATDESTDETWGYSAVKPMKTLKAAYGKIPDDNVKSTIVVMSELVLAPSDKTSQDEAIASGTDEEKKAYMTVDLDWQRYAQKLDYYVFPEHSGEVIITATDIDGTQMDGKLNFGNHTFGLFGNTTIENITISDEAAAIYARYNDLTLGEGIKKVDSSVIRFPATRIYMGVVTYTTDNNDGFVPSSDVRDVRLEINSGSNAYVYGGNRYMTVDAAANCNVDIVVNGGEVTTLYGTSESVPRLKEGYHNNINITLAGGTVKNIYATHASGTVYGNVGVMVKPEAKVTGKIQAKIVDATYGTAAVSGKTILEFSGVGSTYTLPTIVNDFNCLSLTKSQITVTDTSANAWWSAIQSLEMTDDSTLTFSAVPTTSINVTASKVDTEWNMNIPLITAPTGTGNIFTLTAPISHTFDYSATDSQTTWTLAEQTELPYGEATSEEGTAKDIDLKLPDGTNYTALAADATTYDTFLAKVQDLTAAGSGTEVPVVGTVDIKGEIAIYVDPDNGVDSNKGTLAAPVKTIQKALEYVAALQSSEEPFIGIVVYLMGGTYNINETINLTSAHAGKNQIPVIISAYNDEEVVITGGTQIAGSAFKAVSEVSTDAYNKLPAAVRDEVVAVSLTELGISTENAAVTKDGQNYQVFVDGEELTLSRYPNATKLALTGKVLHVGEITNTGSDCGAKGTNADDPNVRFEMTDLRPTLWENTGKIWLTGSLYAEWASTMIGVKEINATTGVMELNGGTGWGCSNQRKQHILLFQYYGRAGCAG